MKVKILKGTNQIGGCITEITSDKGTKIIIDFGEDLPEDAGKTKITNPNIDGLTVGTKKYDAVFITHSHGDHIGLINYVLEDIPVYVEPTSKKIYQLLAAFTYKKIKFDTKDLLFNERVSINDDIYITPYIVDHSSYNSAMLLIEADGKRVLHTGDFRGHGVKGKIFVPTLEEIGRVDLIVTEGTSLSRSVDKYPTEDQLVADATKIFEQYDQVFILQSSTNIDRIRSFYKAARATGKNFIEDIFTTNITCAIENKTIPNPKAFRHVYTWVPTRYNSKPFTFKRKYIFPFWKYRRQAAYEDNKYAMMVKSSMAEDIEKLYNKGHVTNACLVYSMWHDYQLKPEMQEFFKQIEKYGIHDIIELHTSGHADLETIKKLNKLNAQKVIPIHTTEPDKLKKVLDNVYLAQINEDVDL